MLGLDSPPLALTRLQDLYVSDSGELLDVGTVMVDLGRILHVDVVDATGAPIPGHNVLIEDARPFGPFLFPASRTTPQGRATFQRLAAGTIPRPHLDGWPLWRAATDLWPSRVCAGPRNLQHPDRCRGHGEPSPQHTVRRITRRFCDTDAGFGDATTSALASDDADNPMSPRPSLDRSHQKRRASGPRTQTGCVALSDFPPGPARIDLRFPNSRYTQRVTVKTPDARFLCDIPTG